MSRAALLDLYYFLWVIALFCVLLGFTGCATTEAGIARKRTCDYFACKDSCVHESLYCIQACRAGVPAQFTDLGKGAAGETYRGQCANW